MMINERARSLASDVPLLVPSVSHSDSARVPKNRRISSRKDVQNAGRSVADRAK
jgi:hypothetical protein